jgi:hypothetical protein
MELFEFDDFHFRAAPRRMARIAIGLRIVGWVERLRETHHRPLGSEMMGFGKARQERALPLPILRRRQFRNAISGGINGPIAFVGSGAYFSKGAEISIVLDRFWLNNARTT